MLQNKKQNKTSYQHMSQIIEIQLKCENKMTLFTS